MAKTADEQNAVALHDLAEVLRQLEALLLKCMAAGQVTLEDETQYSDLLEQAQILYGRLHGLVGTIIVESYGRRLDAFQAVLSNRSISQLLQGLNRAGFWLEDLAVARSRVNQTIGEVEERRRAGHLTLTPEVVLSWQRLIIVLEAMRQAPGVAFKWASSRPRFLDAFLGRLENSPSYRLASAVATFGGFIGTCVLVAGGI